MRRDALPVEPVTDDRALLGECPVWCPSAERLFWVDIDGRVVHRTDPATGADEVRVLDVRPGSIALRPEPGHLLVAAEHGLHDLDWTSGQLMRLTDVAPDDPATRMNDGRCDPAGRFWVGSMDTSGVPDSRRGGLYRVDPDLTVTTVETDVGVSNSLAFSPDGATMYWADTRRGRVEAFDYDVATGERRNGRVLIDFGDELPGAPDGACVDADGCLWVACVYGWGVARVTPLGVVDRFVELPVEKPSMPAFAGTRLDTMYVTSISSGGSRPAAPGQPLAGALLRLDVGHTGLPEPRFAG